MIDRYVGDNMLSESPITAHAGACKLKDGSINYFTQHHENYSKYLLASASIPAIFPAVKIDGDVWVDGGLVEVAPVDRCIRLHADRIIVVSCYPEESGVVDFNESNPWELADRIMAVATNTILRNNIRQIESVNKRVLEAVGAISGMLSIMPPDFNDKASVDEMVGLEKSIRGVAGKRYLEVYKVQPEERLDYNTGDFKDKNIVSAIDAGFNQGLKLITEVEVTSRRMRS
jgi:predicted acylesterase/phospholipase RssA